MVDQFKYELVTTYQVINIMHIKIKVYMGIFFYQSKLCVHY